MWDYIDGTEVKSEVEPQKWLKNDRRELATVNSGMSPELLIKQAKNSKESWNKLQEVFESTGPIRVYALYKQLTRMRKDSNISISQYVSEFE